MTCLRWDYYQKLRGCTDETVKHMGFGGDEDTKISARTIDTCTC